MLRVLFRVDDGPGIGAGHLKRCFALAEEICSLGGCIRLLTTKPSVLHDEWVELGSEIHVLNQCGIGSNLDLEQVKLQISSFDADWLVVDGYAFSLSWLNSASKHCKLLFVDDLGEIDPSVELLINHNPGAEMRYSKTYTRCNNSLLGLEYFLLRREWREIVVKPEPYRLVITLGGEDPNNHTFRLMKSLLMDARPFIADVVSSAKGRNLEKISALVKEHPDYFTLHKGSVSLPLLFRRAHLALTAGGVTSIEALSIGLIPVVIVLAENQKPGIDYLNSSGNIIAVLYEDECSMDTAARFALDLLCDDQKRLSLSKRTQSMIDGFGPSRIVKYLNKD